VKIFLLSLFLFSSLFALTRTIDQVAAHSGKYFIVSKPIDVKAGDTLLVPQGSEVLFGPLSGITLSGGSLLAPGIRTAPIFFTSTQDTNNSASAFDWNGIDVQHGSSLRLSFSCVAFSASGITAADSDAVFLDSCIFTSNGQWSLSMNGVTSQVEDKKPYSFSPPPGTPLALPQPPQDKKEGSGKLKNRVLIACGIAAAATGAFFLIQAHDAADTYNSYVPGNPAFDNSAPASRQANFNRYRNNYQFNMAIGWSFLGLAALDGGFIALKRRF